MVLLHTLLILGIPQSGPLDTIYDARVTVDVSQRLATMPTYGLGVGVAVWDAHMVDAVIPGLVRDAGFKVIRYPGGSYADIYQWKTGEPTKGIGATVQPGSGFDSFMTMSKKAGTTPLITVNYGSNPEGTGGAEPTYAAEWVRYANKEKGYGIKYWEIGNEVYGNGFYNGTGWEVDLHAPDTKKPADRLKNPLLGPTTYGKNMNAFVREMKAVDPTIKVGAVITCPGGWPDGVEPDWNTNVLKECGKNIDFVVIHWYGEGKTPQELFASLRTVPGILKKARDVVNATCGENAKNVEIWMTEGDGSGFGQRQPGALFAADHFMTWLANGAAHVNWWNLHNGLSVQPNDYGDQGILSSGHSTRGITQPTANTPFPPYYGVQLVDRIVKPGDTFLASTSSRPKLVTHAVMQKSGRLGVMFLNQDPDHAAVVTVKTEGFAPAASGDRFEYTTGRTSIKRSKASIGPEFKLTVPANGIVVVTVGRA